jgi:3-phosphoshikimate 1-carboxyvinyltransferase
MPDSPPRLITPVSRPIQGTVRPPGSKSLTNRALIVAALADGRSRLTGTLDSQDTQVMIESLRKLGIDVRHQSTAQTIEVVGCGGRPPAQAADLQLENSGTSIRFLTPLCTLGQGEYRLDGNPRMRQRPIRDLIDALNRLGADTVCDPNTGCPPVTVRAAGLPGGTTQVAGDISSQFLSGLLMAAPGARSPVTIELSGVLVSEPYVDMTLGVMRHFGVAVDRSTPGRFVIQPQSYRAADYDIEPDASAASYFFAAAAVTGGRVTVEGLSRDALQGDVRFVEALEQMGCRVEWQNSRITVIGGPLRGIDIDMNAVSDTAQTLAAVAPFAEGPTRIRNIAHVRHKETDRIAAVATELRRLGLHVDEHDDGLTIHPGPLHEAVIHTYDDHRMAMSFALVGLRQPGVRIADPQCTAKTYPHFFDDLDKLCGVDG